MTTTHEEHARKHRAWTLVWERARAELRELEGAIDFHLESLGGRPAGPELRELQRKRATILDETMPALVRQADELDAAAERLAAQRRHPAGKRRAGR